VAPDLERALQEDAEVSITTYDANGSPGSVRIWFTYTDGKVYMATGRNSLKVWKLSVNPRVRLRFPGRKQLALDGTGCVCSEAGLVGRVAPLLNSKYGRAWGPDAQMVRRLLGGDIVLLEITPSTNC